MVIGKGMPHQRGFAGLARPGDHNHGIATGEVLKPGFCVPGDIGHGGLLLALDACSMRKKWLIVNVIIN